MNKVSLNGEILSYYDSLISLAKCWSIDVNNIRRNLNNKNHFLMYGELAVDIVNSIPSSAILNKIFDLNAGYMSNTSAQPIAVFNGDKLICMYSGVYNMARILNIGDSIIKRRLKTGKLLFDKYRLEKVSQYKFLIKKDILIDIDLNNM